MTVVLTDAYFEGGQPIGVSYCGDCRACVDACPAGAPTGEDWNKRMDREEFYDAHACNDKILEFMEQKGLGAKVCGMCIAACPYTQEYIERALK